MMARGPGRGHGPLYDPPQTAEEVELNPAQAELAAELRRTRGDTVADAFVSAIVTARAENGRQWRHAPDPLRAIGADDLRALLLEARDATGPRRRAARMKLRHLTTRTA